MVETTFYFVSFIGAIQGVLLAAFLFFNKGNRRRIDPALPVPASTTALATYVLFFSAGLLEPFLTKSLNGSIGNLVVNFLSVSNLLYGPLLYLFVYFLTWPERRFEQRQLLHFLPFILLWTSVLVFSFFRTDLLAIDLVQFVAFEFLIVQILTYNILAIRRLKSHGKRVIHFYSTMGAGDLRWLKSLLIVITMVYLASFLISHLVVFGVEMAADFYLAVQILITCIIYAMTYRLILQPQLFIPVGGSPEMRDKSQGKRAKYLKSGLKPGQAEEYLKLLTDLMEKEKVYLDPDLTIFSLSAKLNISRNHLTQVINERLHQNFYEYINGHRVEEVKRMLHNPKWSHLSLAGIGMQAGFKSKTSFNINFKKATGQTPTAWKTQPLKVHTSEKNVLS